MVKTSFNVGELIVAARMGCVDGNGIDEETMKEVLVAARMGCVDGNGNREGKHAGSLCRSPHGLRGLKYKPHRLTPYLDKVAARMGCVDGNRLRNWLRTTD